MNTRVYATEFGQYDADGYPIEEEDNWDDTDEEDDETYDDDFYSAETEEDETEWE